MNDRIKAALTSISRGHIVFAALVGLSIAASIYEAKQHRSAPGRPVEVRFAALGRANASQVIAAHAFAYEAAAKAVRAKVPIATVVASIPNDSAAALASAGKRYLVPELAKLLPPGTAEGSITDKQRADLADAFEGFARGIRGKYP